MRMADIHLRGDEQVLRLKSGLLVTRMGGGQVDTASGEFVFEVDEGWRVEDGKVKHLVRDANLAEIVEIGA